MATIFLRTLLFAASVVVGIAAPLQAQDPAPVKVRFLRTAKGQPPLPPLVHLSIELENSANEPRWLLVSLSRELRLPKDGKFASDPEGGLPLFVLEAKEGKGRAAMVGFLGEPRFTAFYLPAGAKVVLEDFELPSVEELAELDWLEAKTLQINGKQPLEKWLPIPVDSTGGVRIGKDANWIDALRDGGTGEPRADLPKEKVASVIADVVRSGRLAVEGFQAAPRYYHPAEKDEKAERAAGWSLLGSFRSVRPFKVEHLAFAPDGSWLVASLQTFKVIGLDLGKGRERVFPLGEKTMARFFAFSPEGNLLVKQASEPTDEDSNLDLADWTASKVLDVLRFSSRITLGNIDHVPSPDGQKVAVAQRTSFNLWDFVKLETTNRFTFPESANGYLYRTGLFSPDGKRFAAGFESNVSGGKAIVWDVASGKILAEFDSKQNGIQFLAFAQDGGLLAGAGKQTSAIWVWSVDDRAERAVIRDIPFTTITALAFAPDGKTLAVADVPFAGATPSRGIRVFNVASKQSLGTLGGLRQPITAMAFARDSSRLAAGDHVGSIRVWERK